MQVMERFLLPAARCASVVLGLFLAGQAVLAQHPPATGKFLISDVIISGNVRMTTEQIKMRLHVRVGQEYNPAVVDDDVRELYKTNQFSNIATFQQADGADKVKIYFSLREIPNLVQKVTFLGANHIKPDELLSLTGVKAGAPLNPNLNLQGCQRILNKYEELGRAFAHCKLIKGGSLADDEVIYQITEGPVLKVRDIQFIGNTFVGGARLATQIKSSKQLLGCLGGTYNKQMADADISTLYEYFRSFGYLDVRISLETARSDDGGLVTLIFHIQEGPRYKVLNVPEVHGCQDVPGEQLAAQSRVKPGSYLDEKTIKGDIKLMTDVEGYRGHAVQITPFPEFLPDTPGVVKVRYEVAEQPPARVGQIHIIGNTRTRYNVILRQIPLFPGQILTYPDLDIARANLTRLNIFTHGGGQGGQDGPAPEIRVIDSPDGSAFKDVVVEVNEANTGSLVFGVGVNSNSGLTGSIVLNERNFDIFHPPSSLSDFLNGTAWRGGGQNLRIMAMPGTVVQQYMATFTEPYLFDTPNSMTDSLYYFQRYYNEYFEQREGGRVLLGRQLNRWWSTSFTTRIENVAVNNVAAGAPIDYQEAVGNNFQIGFMPMVARDTRDSLLRPTQGSQVQLSYEELTGEHTFGVLNMLAHKYWTTYQRPDGSGRHVIAYRGQFGLASANTPVYERFFAGGFTTIRGFQFRGVGPNINGYFIGGDFMLLNSLEYQIPIKANDQIFVVGFVDSGTVSSRITQFDNYAVSAGFGIRFTVPMLGPVPIALDLGFPIVKPNGDITQIFNFFMGFTR